MSRHLFELARLHGIQPSYIDMAGKRQQAGPEAILLVLKAMGAGVEKFDDVPKVLPARRDQLRERKVEPVMVAWDGKLDGRTFEFGYHDAEIDGHETFVISAPAQAYFPASPPWKGGVAAPSETRRRRGGHLGTTFHNDHPGAKGQEYGVRPLVATGSIHASAVSVARGV